MLKLSIITINFNNKAGLQKTIDSVITQTYKDFEWIVIDGGSTDGSKELIEKYSAHITYWVSEPDKGIYNAMNKGVKVAKGEYLQFLNSGDCLYDKNVLTDFVKRDNKEDVIYGNAVIVDNNGVIKGKFIAPDHIRLSFFWNHALNHQATFFHRRCFEHYLYNEQNKIASDVELYVYLAYHGYTFSKYDKNIVFFDNTGIGCSTNSSDELGGIFSRTLPQCVLDDYEDMITFRDVDLAIMTKRVIKSNKFYRHVARVLIYPIYFILTKRHGQ